MQENRIITVSSKELLWNTRDGRKNHGYLQSSRSFPRLSNLGTWYQVNILPPSLLSPLLTRLRSHSADILSTVRSSAVLRHLSTTSSLQKTTPLTSHPHQRYRLRQTIVSHRPVNNKNSSISTSLTEPHTWYELIWKTCWAIWRHILHNFRHYVLKFLTFSWNACIAAYYQVLKSRKIFQLPWQERIKK